MLILPTKKNLIVPHIQLLKNLGEKIIDGKNIELKWDIKYDYKNKKRVVKIIALIDGVKHESLAYSSYLLHHKELADMMKKAGFKNIQRVEIKGEKTITFLSVSDKNFCKKYEKNKQ